MSHTDSNLPRVISPWKESFAGLCSAFLTIGFTYPLTKLIYRQIIENQNAAMSMSRIQHEGIKYLYRGVLPPLLQKCVAMSAMFGIFKAVSQPLHEFQLNEYAEKLSASAATGTIEAVFMPLERMQLLLVSAQYNKKFRNLFGLTKLIMRNYGTKEFYRGFKVILVRNCASHACFFITKEELQKKFGQRDNAYKQNVQNFLIGAAVGSFLTIALYPLKVIKVQFHKELGGKFKTIKETIMEIYRKESGGIMNFYRGLITNTIKALLSWGITYASYEYIKRLI